jgi:hypothetical protein
MKLSKVYSLLIVLSIGLWYGCNFKTPDYEADVLTPVFSSSLGPQQLTDLLPLEYADSLSSQEIGLNPFVPVAADTNFEIGPFLMVDTFNRYLGFTGQSMRIRFDVFNNLPIDFESNSRVLLVNANKNDTVLDTRITIPMPGRATRIIFVTPVLSSAFIDNDFRIIITELRTNGTGSQPNLTLYDKIILRVKFEPAFVSEYFIEENKTYTLSDTAKFSFSNNSEFMSASKGEVMLNFENSFPASLGFQAFFLDENKLVIDTLLTDRTILTEGAEIDTLGFTIASTEKRRKINTFWERNRMENIKKTRFVVSTARIRTSFVPGNAPVTLVLRPSNQLRLSITSRLSVHVRDNE